MLITVLFYLLIGALLMGGVYLTHPTIIIDGGLDDIFCTKSSTVNCIIGIFICLSIIMIWLPVLIAVIIKRVTDKINE